MLRFAEEIVLLLLDEQRGGLAPVPERSLHIILSGAVLMELALEGRIDTDANLLFLIDATPLDDDLLDPTLAEIARVDAARPTGDWILDVSVGGEKFLDLALERLTRRGILETDRDGFWSLTPIVSRSRRYPVESSGTQEEVRLRIMRILFSDDIPTPRDIVLIVLASACDLFSRLLSRDELAAVHERIELLAKMDLIGQAVASVLTRTEPAAKVRRPGIDPPAARGLPLLGNALDLYQNAPRFLASLYLKLGPVFRIRLLRHRFTVLAGPDANLFAMRHGRKYLRSFEPWADFNAEFGVAQTMISADGESHLRFRKMERRGYSRTFAEQHLDRLFEIARAEVALWTSKRSVPVGYALQQIVVEQLGRVAAGTSPRAYLDDLIFYVRTLLAARFFKRPFLDRSRRFRRARARIDALYREILEKHTEQGRNRTTDDPDLIDDLLAAHEADSQSLPEVDLKLSVLGPFIAGLDTVSAVCAFVLYSLLKHPDVLARVQPEIDALFAGGRTPSAEDLRRLDVLQRVVMEALRLYPVAPFVFRTVSNSFEFGGYQLTAGEQVIVAMTVPHFLPQCFPQPDKFDIDRFTGDRHQHVRSECYAPFGLGTHRCLGSGFAEVQIAVTMATILHEVSLTLDPKDYVVRTLLLPPRPGRSFKVRVAPRRAIG